MEEPSDISEIRERVGNLAYTCPLGEYRPECPFKLLGMLSYSSRLEVINRMSEGELRELFQMTGDCRCPSNPNDSKA